MKLRNLLLAALFFAGCPGVNAQTKPGKLSPTTAIALAKADDTRQRVNGAARPDSLVSVIINVNPSTLDRPALDALGVKVTSDLDDMLTILLPFSAIPSLADIEGVDYVQLGSSFHQTLDLARADVRATQMNSGEGLAHPFTGEGIVVGIIDGGFEYTHSAFHAPDGTLRIKRVWNQTAKPKEGQSAPDKFAYGVELTDPDSIEAAGGDLDNDSHGSHVASIAAGSQNISDGAFRGMAPEADLVFVAVDLSNINRIPDAITYIFDYADEVGKPCVINMSLGTQVGPHDGTSSIDTYIDRLSGPGRIIVGSAGNDNPNKCHLFRVIGDQQVGKPLSTFIKYGYTLSTKYTGGTIDIWADKGMDLNVALVLYKLSTAEEVERASVVFDGEVGSLTLGRNIGGSIIYGTETNPLNGKTHVKMKSQVTSIRTDYAIAVEVTPLNAGELNLWAYNDIFFTANDLPAFMQPTAEESTVKEIGGTARRIITVGAYTTRDEFLVYGDTEPEHTVDATGELCYFSGNGPTADGRVKPNITAPGAAIEAAFSRYNTPHTYLSRIVRDRGLDMYYGYMQGTSMATPVVSGIVAAWLQAYPRLSPEQALEVLRLTARRDSFTGEIPAGGSNRWGHGKIDAMNGLFEVLRLAELDGISAPEGVAPRNAVFTICGQRVSRPQAPGLYIVKGKKFLIP